MTVIAHLTDIHLPSLPLPRLGELNLKQALGFLNWHWSRKNIHRAAALETLMDDLSEQSYSHMLVSGDLVNLGLKAEFKAGIDWLNMQGDHNDVSYVPGNHDYYPGNHIFEQNKSYLDFMKSDGVGASLGGGTGPDVPFVKIINKVALIGVNSGVTTPLFKAFGKVSDQQLEQLAKILKKAKAHGFYRLIGVHHPPIHGLTSPSRSMTNDTAFRALIKEAGAELVLYGHNHVQRYDRLLTCDGPCHVVGAPSASVGQAGKYDLARYNLYNISRGSNGWITQITGRGINPQLTRVNTVENKNLSDM